MTTKTSLYSIIVLLTLTSTATAQNLLTDSQAWGYGFLCGFGLSLLGFLAAIVLVFIRKCITQSAFKIFVNMLYALGCGAIVGDAMIHILPQAFINGQTNKHIVSLIFMCALGFFIILERLFESCGITHEHWGDQQEHQHIHTHDLQKKKDEICPQHKHDEERKQELVASSQNLKGKSDVKMVLQVNQNIQHVPGDKKQQQTQKGCLQNLKGKGSAGYLNLLSSFIHNFFDGFAIGVGFASKDKVTYIPIIVAVFVHQIPRQMGDVGILLKSGFSGIQTILCNGFINFMSLFGVIAGLGLGSIDGAAQNYIMVFVAGNFIYIGADIWKHLLRNKSILLNIIQFIICSIGVGAMFLILLAQA